jgi:arylsulfatase A-like enzyme
LAYATNSESNLTNDGMNLKPYMEGAKSKAERPIFWHYPHYSNQGGNPSSAIRLGDFKLIHDLELDTYELYNLKADIGETKNLASTLPEKTVALKEMLNNWISKNYNKKLEPNPKWNGSDLK